MQEPTGGAAVSRRSGRSALDRILESPQAAELVPRLPPETLYAAIAQAGLEACGAVLALATPAQIAQVLDVDLWQPPAAGADDAFDPDRFGLWLEVLVEQGADVAARMVAALDPDLAAAGLAQHVRVFHIATLDAYVTSDGTDVPAVLEPDGGLTCEIAGHRIMARRADAWDAIVDVLTELDAAHAGPFAELMRRCRALSHSRAEADGLDALLTGAGQAMFDLADAREQRRDAQGYVAPAAARAFLDGSRRLAADAADPAFPASRPAVSTAIGPFVPGAALSPFEARLRAMVDRHPARRAGCEQELAWLANALMAGCGIDGRSFTAAEASAAVMATCSLGLESWPGRQARPLATGELLASADLTALFRVGWTVLYDEVCGRAVGGLLDALAGLPRPDSDIQADLRALRGALVRHWRAGTPWLAREAMDVLATLDLAAAVTLQALIAECPVLPATIDPAAPRGRHRIDPKAFTFFAERRQIAAVQAFVEQLPALLRG